MDHLKIYNAIINKAKTSFRVKLNKHDKNYVYYERHHILPKCVNGTDDVSNLILLTAREHFICHQLLIHIYPNDTNLLYAFNRLVFDKRGRKITSRTYEMLRFLFKTADIKFSKEHKQKMSLARKGKSYDEFYGDKADKMRQHRVKQTSGKGNPKARKYIIHNKELNQYWYTHGNYNQFCSFYHVSNRTLLLSRKNDKYINNWKCVPYDETNQLHIKVFNDHNFAKVL